MPHAAVNGLSIYYELHGPADATVVVLNNGILMNAAASWQLQTPALARRFRVLQYDCRGQGQSDHPDSPYTMSAHADDLASLLDSLGIAAAHIAGISYGGEVAQAFALAHPSRVRSLVLADTVSEVSEELRRVIQQWRDVARTGDADRFFEVTMPWNFSPAFIERHGSFLAEARRRYKMLDLPAVARLCDCFLTTVDFTSRLGEIAVPTCILVGERDRLKDRGSAERIHRWIPHAEFHVLAGAGHASCLERPHEFNTIVMGFLTKRED